MSESTALQRPVPEPTADSAPYWAALREHRLLLQQCAACGKLRHYPRPLCDACYSGEAGWTQSSGAGVIHSWTVAHHAFHPAFKSALPYTVVTIELAEGVRMLGPWRGPAEAVRVGQRVRLVFEDVLPELTLPAFDVA
jgi:uncharacterized OB-fold protein